MTEEDVSNDLELIAALSREPGVPELLRAVTGASPAREAIEWLGDVVRGRRAQTQVKVLQATLEAIHNSGLPPGVVPAKQLVSLLDYSGLEDPADDEMVTRWGNLLANAATSGNRRHIAFPAILAELEPSEALMLETMYTRVAGGGGQMIGRAFQLDEVSVHRLADELQLDLEVAQIGAANLARLRLVHEDSIYVRQVEPVYISTMWLTLLGYEFIRACQRPPRGRAHC